MKSNERLARRRRVHRPARADISARRDKVAARHLIDWQRDKTNHEYVLELRRDVLRRPFAELTTLFEYVWYGDFTVDEGIYGRVKRTFDHFDLSMGEEAA